MRLKLSKITFLSNTLIKDVFFRFNETAVHTDGKGFGLVVDKKKRCIGTVTDGDIRRGINKLSMNAPVSNIMNRNFNFVLNNFSKNRILREFEILFQNEGKIIFSLPVLDKKGRIVNIINYSDINFNKSLAISKIKRVIVKIPARVSFSGGGTDFTNIINNKKTYVISSPINRILNIQVDRRRDNQINLKINNKKIITSNTQKVKKNKNFFGHIFNFCNLDFGVDLNIRSQIDEGSGLGGSSAMTCGIICAIQSLKSRKKVNLYDLVDQSYKVERLNYGAIGGWQDFYAVTFKGIKLITLSSQNNKVKKLNIRKKNLSKIKNCLYFYKFGSKRKSHMIHKNSNHLIENKKKFIDEMNKITLSLKSSLKNGNIKKFGEFITDSWELKKKLNPKVSSKKIDIAIKSILEFGAYGCKLLGAGKSGYLLVVSEKNIPKIIEKKLARMKLVRKKIKLINQGIVVTRR